MAVGVLGAARTLGVVLTAMGAALTGCAPTGVVRAEGPAPTAIAWTGPVYVLDSGSAARREPEIIQFTANSTFHFLVWKRWGSARATATGYETDLACLSGCKGDELDGYPVTIVLSDLVRRKYAAYYRTASVTSPEPLPSWAEDLSLIHLRVPAR
ncbi:hypothetical protein [Streptomyces sp. NPDC051572]|uniref:hypothetical protein n=1 Tax=unclassified Streptomyces TaxID=2593676 RepID=UPI00344EDBBF